MPSETRDAAPILKSFWNNRAALVRTRRHHRARSATICNRRVRARHGAAHENNFFSLADLHHLEILHRHALVTEMTWRSLVFPNPAGSRTIADCADAAVRFRTVRRALSMKVVPFHHALKPFSFRSANHIDVIACLKLR